jgi:hypothetical protein
MHLSMLRSMPPCARLCLLYRTHCLQHQGLTVSNVLSLSLFALHTPLHRSNS